MRVKVSIELDLPEVKDGNVNLKDEFVKGISWEMAYIIQNVFDNFLNFAITAHLMAATKWLAKSKEDIKSPAYFIHQSHNNWADILRNAEPTMKVEKV